MKLLCGIGIAIGAVMLDQATKYGASIGGFEITFNTGLFFGLITVAPWLFIVIGTSVLAGAVFYTWHRKLYRNRGYCIGFGMALGGMLSNAADRLIFGAVRDIISLSPVTRLNFADILLTIGAILVSIAVLKQTEDGIYYGKQITRR